MGQCHSVWFSRPAVEVWGVSRGNEEISKKKKKKLRDCFLRLAHVKKCLTGFPLDFLQMSSLPWWRGYSVSRCLLRVFFRGASKKATLILLFLFFNSSLCFFLFWQFGSALCYLRKLRWHLLWLKVGVRAEYPFLQGGDLKKMLQENKKITS